MGTFAVRMRVSNWEDVIAGRNGQTTSLEIDALVDTGALRTSLPAEVVEALNLRELGSVRAITADGARHQYRLMGVAGVEVQGRQWFGEVVELPRGTTPLLGAITLESMDWHISPAEQKLLPNPESPDMPEVLMLGIEVCDGTSLTH